MNAHPRIRTPLIAAAIALGVLGDQLLRVNGQLALNAVLWSAAGVIALGVLVQRRGWPAAREANVLMAIALLFISGLAWRDAEALMVLNVLAAATAVSLAAAQAGAAWIRTGDVTAYVRAGALTAVSLAAGPLTLLGSEFNSEPKPVVAVRRRWGRHALAASRGVVLAMPPLLLFGALFMAADPVFARVVTDTFAFDLATLTSHILLAGFLAWVSVGYMRGFLLRTPFADVVVPLPQPRIGITDGAVALGLLNALFLAFVVIQLRYLFGGAGMIEVTPGLSYAEYARRGFFELVTVAALVIPLLLLADWSVQRESSRAERIFRLSAVVQIVLLFAIMSSALHRMRLYQQAYGLTELRLYTTVFMGWIALVLAWLTVTVLRGRRRRFAFGALVTGLVAVAGLNIVNPHALIARVNGARAAVGHAYDARYTADLGADAVRTLLATISRLPPDDRCRVARELLEDYLPPRPGGWRTWNYGDAAARRAVQRSAGRLRAACPDAPITLR